MITLEITFLFIVKLRNAETLKIYIKIMLLLPLV